MALGANDIQICSPLARIVRILDQFEDLLVPLKEPLTLSKEPNDEQMKVGSHLEHSVAHEVEEFNIGEAMGVIGLRVAYEKSQQRRNPAQEGRFGANRSLNGVDLTTHQIRWHKSFGEAFEELLKELDLIESGLIGNGRETQAQESTSA